MAEGDEEKSALLLLGAPKWDQQRPDPPTSLSRHQGGATLVFLSFSFVAEGRPAAHTIVMFCSW